MYYLKTECTISAAHFLAAPYIGKCNSLHGHNWQIIVYCKSRELDDKGMVVDFSVIKKEIEKLDHTELNKSIPQPTAENIAKYLCLKIKNCYKIKVIETKGNETIYEK
jgi:6-pyruvoyltetrahydropterin/6-carboxytetrahydropterin synthase